MSWVNLSLTGLEILFTTITDFFILIFVIVYGIMFFVLQYYLIKGYVWLFKYFINELPIIREWFNFSWITGKERTKKKDYIEIEND